MDSLVSCVRKADSCKKKYAVSKISAFDRVDVIQTSVGSLQVKFYATGLSQEVIMIFCESSNTKNFIVTSVHLIRLCLH